MCNVSYGYTPNPCNAALLAQAELARRVQRLSAGDVPDWAPPGIAAVVPTESEKMKVVIDTSVAGDNIIVAGSLGYIIRIFELRLWNVAAQTLTLVDSQDPIPLEGPLASYPALTGYYLPDQGSEPHYECKPGGNFVLNLGAATRVTGFVKFTVKTA